VKVAGVIAPVDPEPLPLVRLDGRWSGHMDLGVMRYPIEPCAVDTQCSITTKLLTYK